MLLLTSRLFSFKSFSNGSTEALAAKVLEIWKDERGPEATMENLESQLQAIGRADILKNFKRLAYSSYGTRDRLLVTEIRRPVDSEHTNGFVNGHDNFLIDPSSETSVEVDPDLTLFVFHSRTVRQYLYQRSVFHFQPFSMSIDHCSTASLTEC